MSFQVTKQHQLFIKPEKPIAPDQVPEILKERGLRTLKSYQKSYCQYIVDSQTGYKQDSYEQMNPYFISISPKECIKYNLVSLQRVILPANSPLAMFENDKYELDSTVKECLTATLQVTVLNEKSDCIMIFLLLKSLLLRSCDRDNIN
jgi:hypothetical protein